MTTIYIFKTKPLSYSQALIVLFIFLADTDDGESRKQVNFQKEWLKQEEKITLTSESNTPIGKNSLLYLSVVTNMLVK